MTTSHHELWAALEANPDFAEAFANAATPAAAEAVAAGYGVRLAPGQLAGSTAVGDLSDAELARSSGAGWQDITRTAWVYCDTDHAVCTRMTC